MTTRRRLIPSLVLLTALAFGGAGCAAMSPTGGGADSAAQPEVADGGGQAAVPEAVEDAADPAVIITGRIVITVVDPIAAAEDATDVVTGVGGRIDARREYAAGSYGGGARAELTLRVPADRVDEVRTALGALGEVEETSLESTDVSATQRDLDARITTLRTSIARYTEWLGTATKTSDLIELETEISARQSELESLEAEQRSLEDRIAMSTIELTLGEEYVAPQTEPEDFGSALAAGWAAFVGFWTQLALGLAIGLPWLLLLAVIAAVIVLLVHRSGRRRRAAVMPEAPRPAPVQPSGLEQPSDVVGGQ